MGNIEVAALIGLFGTLCSVIFGFIGYKKGLKIDSYKDGEIRGSFKSDIQYMKRLLEDVLLQQRHINDTLGAHSERLTRVEECTKQAHRRIDEMRGVGA